MSCIFPLSLFCRGRGGDGQHALEKQRDELPCKALDSLIPFSSTHSEPLYPLFLASVLIIFALSCSMKRQKSPLRSTDESKLVKPPQISPKLSITLEGQGKTHHLLSDFPGIGVGIGPI